VAERYGLIDADTRRLMPGWFVVDQSGHLRASGPGTDNAGRWAAIAALALGSSGPPVAGGH
jgi:hypothetical protein